MSSCSSLLMHPHRPNKIISTSHASSSSRKMKTCLVSDVRIERENTHGGRLDGRTTTDLILQPCKSQLELEFLDLLSMIMTPAAL